MAIEAPWPPNEHSRLKALTDLNVLDTTKEPVFDRITALAATICGAKMALVSLVDRERQWFKSTCGFDAAETPREFAFCAHAIWGDAPLIVQDARSDARFHDNPLVLGAPFITFYAGFPLVMKDGCRIGTLCILHTETLSLNDNQFASMKQLADWVVTALEHRALNDPKAWEPIELPVYSDEDEAEVEAAIISEQANAQPQASA